MCGSPYSEERKNREKVKNRNLTDGKDFVGSEVNGVIGRGEFYFMLGKQNHDVR